VSRPTPASMQTPIQWVKQWGCNADHFSPSSARVKNALDYTPWTVTSQLTYRLGCELNGAIVVCFPWSRHALWPTKYLMQRA
jgi:hypothetical protein